MLLDIDFRSVVYRRVITLRSDNIKLMQMNGSAGPHQGRVALLLGR